MSEDHGGYGYAAPDAGRLRVALVVVAGFLVAEVLVGFLAGSVALLADAGHLLTDVAGLGAALVAARLSRRPAGGALTYGLRRLDVLAAQANGALLLVVGVLIAIEAATRLVHPEHVDGLAMVVVAGVGLAVNTFVTLVLSGGDRTSINVGAALAHVRADALSSAVTVGAGAAILATGWHRADPLASLMVVAVVLVTGVRLLLRTGRVLLEAAPAGVDPDAVHAAMTADPRVASVHELHLWLITSGFPALSAHVLVRPDDDCHAVRADLERVLASSYGIAHTTLQVEHARDDLLSISARQPGEAGVGG